jgi:Ca2+-binding RTX toxin-like protein
VQSDGTVTVTGTNDAGDNILVGIVNGSVQVVFDGTPIGSFTASTVTSIVINAGAGADTITSDSSNTIATEIHGGDGDDQITGGGGNDILFGEGDNDTLVARQGDDVAVGGDGNDELLGGNGRDVLIGGVGGDTIEGDNGDDILIAGETPHDADPIALASIRALWVADATYTARVNSLKDGLLASLTDDEEPDELVGGTGQDWFLVVGGNDHIVGKTLKSEVLTLA